MITSTIILFLFNSVITIVGLVLYPINALIVQYLPSLNTALTAINSFLGIISNTLAYSVSLSMLSQTALSLIVIYYSFVLIFPMSVWFIKLIVKWYNKLKP